MDAAVAADSRTAALLHRLANQRGPPAAKSPHGTPVVNAGPQSSDITHHPRVIAKAAPLGKQHGVVFANLRSFMLDISLVLMSTQLCLLVIQLHLVPPAMPPAAVGPHHLDRRSRARPPQYLPVLLRAEVASTVEAVTIERPRLPQSRLPHPYNHSAAAPSKPLPGLAKRSVTT
jgi:hypothetical protein